MRAVVEPEVGLLGATTRVNPDVLEGWGVRNRDWQFGVGIQHEVLPADVARRQLQPALVEQLLHHPQHRADGRGLRRGDAHRSAAPAASRRRRLPGDVPGPQQPDRRGRREPIRTTPRNQDYGDETHYWHGVDMSLSARAARDSLFVQAGHQHRPRRERHLRRADERFGRPMAPTGTVIAQGIVDGQPTATSPSRG